MKIKPCLYYLGLSCFPISAMSLLNIFYSFYFNYFDNTISYLFVLFSSLLIGLIFFKIGKKESESINIYQQILLSYLYVVELFLHKYPLDQR